MNYKIDERLKNFLPHLNPAEFRELRQAISRDGHIREPIIIWKNPDDGEHYIIDGHNRHEIGTELEIEIPVTVNDALETFADVQIWMLANQLGRRNIKDAERTILIGQLYNLRKVRKDQLKKDETTGRFVETEKTGDTAEQIAQEFDIAPSTVRRAGKTVEILEQADDPELTKKFLNQQVSQKELIKQAKPEIPPVPPVPVAPVEPTYGKDENPTTEYISRKAIEAYNFMRDAVRRFDEIKSDKERPVYIIPAILAARFSETTETLKELLHGFNALKFVYVCIACEGKGPDENKGCEACTGGFVTYDDHLTQEKLEKDKPAYRGQNAKKEEPKEAAK